MKSWPIHNDNREVFHTYREDSKLTRWAYPQTQRNTRGYKNHKREKVIIDRILFSIIMENRCTWITYTDWRKEILYKREPVVRELIATVSYPELTKEQVQEIIDAKIERVRELLDKHF